MTARQPAPTALRFGVQLTPTTDLPGRLELAHAAEEGGLDLIGLQDHPYVPDLADTLALMATLAAHTHRIAFFPDVATLPLRPPTMLAKAIASLDRLTGGRIELGLGAGGYWSAITRMGVDRRSPGQAVDSLAEAVEVIRALWRTDRTPVTYTGHHHTLDGLRPGPPPQHPVGIWLGAQGPRMLELTGQVADGWAAPIAPYLPYQHWPAANTRIDTAAQQAGRHPEEVVRIAHLVGRITTSPQPIDITDGSDPVRATPHQWADLLARLATDQPFTTFIFWPEEETPQQVQTFAQEVAPRVRQRAATPTPAAAPR